MNKLSVIITSYNEEKNIRACLESVKWADEIMVVDSFSTDRTLEIAQEYDVRILKHAYENSAAQKNWALLQASSEWVLIVDSDERVTPKLQKEIRKLMAGIPPFDGYRILRQNYFFGYEMKHAGWETNDVLRLFRKDKGSYPQKRVHADAEVEGNSVGNLKGKLTHYTYRSMDQYLEKFGRYTTWASRDLDDKGVRPGYVRLFLRPLFRFFKQYILRLGILDGKPGLVLCMLSTFSVFMKYAKLWVRLEGNPDWEDGGEGGKD